jgi:ABC-type branched-subunit amino acid transport system ATPase component
MSNEKPHQTSSPPDELGSSVEKEANSPEDIVERHASFQNSALSTAHEASDFSYEPRNTTLDQWGLNKQTNSMLKHFQEHKLPLTSSKSSIIWKDFSVRGAGASVTYQQTVGQILRSPFTAIQNLRLRRKPQERVILQGLEGVLREGEMLLVLGRPGSGCSTLLKSLCGLTDEYLGWQGDVRYNGIGVETFKRRFRGDAIYVPEGKKVYFHKQNPCSCCAADVHFPHLKVGDTLKFTSETKTPRLRPEGESKEDFVTSKTNLWAAFFGLRHALNTKVGNEFVRGISGGERRRVSLGEAVGLRLWKYL